MDNSKNKLNVVKETDETFKSSALYDAYNVLKKCWKADTCAPRMRKDWCEDNLTLGQCSITAFLLQDEFGGDVYGVPLGDGNYHCFNVIDNTAYDITSSQFGKKLDYNLEYPQSRESHFARKEKYERYLILKERYDRQK